MAVRKNFQHYFYNLRKGIAIRNALAKEGIASSVRPKLSEIEVRVKGYDLQMSLYNRHGENILHIETESYWRTEEKNRMVEIADVVMMQDCERKNEPRSFKGSMRLAKIIHCVKLECNSYWSDPSLEAEIDYSYVRREAA